MTLNIMFSQRVHPFKNINNHVYMSKPRPNFWVHPYLPALYSIQVPVLQYLFSRLE